MTTNKSPGGSTPSGANAMRGIQDGKADETAQFLIRVVLSFIKSRRESFVSIDKLLF
jgi:hypothetical protein